MIPTGPPPAPVLNLGPCDTAEVGTRFNRLHSSLPDGTPDAEKCNANPFRFRGTPGQFCSVIKFYNECKAIPHNAACLGNTGCTAAGTPWFCCTGAGTGTCNQKPFTCCTGPGTGTCEQGRPNDICEEAGVPLACCTGEGTGICDLPRNDNAVCTAPGVPQACCTGPGAGNCDDEAEECILKGRCANDRTILCDEDAQDECGPAGPCDLGVTGRCERTTNVRCSEGKSPYPFTDHGFERWSDPHPKCELANFGPQARPDVDCDGAEDPTIDTDADGDGDLVGDACPYYTESNMIDTTPGVPPNTANTDNVGRLNECSCGDANLDGTVAVQDLVVINAQIFNPPGQGTPAAGRANLAAPLSDANEDNTISVSDIIATNTEIFNPKTSRCGRSPVINESPFDSIEDP
jgi:hypothetical protein